MLTLKIERLENMRPTQQGSAHVSDATCVASKSLDTDYDTMLDYGSTIDYHV